MKKKVLKVVNNPKDLPVFKTEEEEREFWATHQMGEGFFTENNDDSLLPPLRDVAKSRPISIRLGQDLEKRLRIIAEHKGMTYQTLLKQFVVERTYEEERRLGIFKRH